MRWTRALLTSASPDRVRWVCGDPERVARMIPGVHVGALEHGWHPTVVRLRAQAGVVTCVGVARMTESSSGARVVFQDENGRAAMRADLVVEDHPGGARLNLSVTIEPANTRHRGLGGRVVAEFVAALHHELEVAAPDTTVPVSGPEGLDSRDRFRWTGARIAAVTGFVATPILAALLRRALSRRHRRVE